MEAKLHHSDSLDILCRKVNLMALDTAMKIEEILKIPELFILPETLT